MATSTARGGIGAPGGGAEKGGKVSRGSGTGDNGNTGRAVGAQQGSAVGGPSGGTVSKQSTALKAKDPDSAIGSANAGIGTFSNTEQDQIDAYGGDEDTTSFLGRVFNALNPFGLSFQDTTNPISKIESTATSFSPLRALGSLLSFGIGGPIGMAIGSAVGLGSRVAGDPGQVDLGGLFSDDGGGMFSGGGTPLGNDGADPLGASRARASANSSVSVDTRGGGRGADRVFAPVFNNLNRAPKRAKSPIDDAFQPPRGITQPDGSPWPLGRF